MISKNVDIPSVNETKLDISFPNSQILIPGFHEPMKLDITSIRGGMLIYIKTFLLSRTLANFKLPETIQVIPLEINLRNQNWLCASKSPLQKNDYLLDTLNDFLDFYLGVTIKNVVFGDFNLESTNPSMMIFIGSHHFLKPIKNNTFLVSSCIDSNLTNKKCPFKNCRLLKPELVIIIKNDNY